MKGRSLKRRLLPFWHLSTIVTLYSLHVCVAVYDTWWALFTAPLAAIALTASLSIVHEAAHNTYFTNRELNSVVGRVMALPLLLNFSLYKRDHMIHHKHQGTEKDSETLLRIHSMRELFSSLLLNVHLLELWRRSLKLTFRSTNKAVRNDGITILLISTFLIVATAMSPLWLLTLFWIPFLMSVVFDAIIGLPEHALITPVDDEGVPTRNLSAGPIGDFLIYWVNCHSEHHTSPNLSGPELPMTRTHESYLDFYRSAMVKVRGSSTT